MEEVRVVDFLPDRDSASFVGWLREHPGAEIIYRDRAGAYSSADVLLASAQHRRPKGSWSRAPPI
ncbi:hypothetical protein [Streptomyces sp. NPDC020362]|uniref:hypothetical protein n=1 Tax=unclassified Streptomyces TaxID=2593676 RepID=UPI0033EB1922